MKALLKQDFVEAVGSRETQSGFKGTLYQPTIRAKVAFYLDEISPDQFIKKTSKGTLATGLATIALFLEDICVQK